MTDRTDTERLDWLESGTVCGTLKTDTRVYVEMNDGCEFIGANYRDAIDAAMDGEKRDG